MAERKPFLLRVDRVQQLAVHRGPIVNILDCHLQIGHDRLERVVDFVRDACCQRTQRGQLFGPDQLRLRRLKGGSARLNHTLKAVGVAL